MAETDRNGWEYEVFLNIVIFFFFFWYSIMPKSWLTGKDFDAGRDWGQEEKGTTEDEMAGWHHWLRRTWVLVNSGSWWWAWRPGVLRFMGSQRVRHDSMTELNWTEQLTLIWMTLFSSSVFIILCSPASKHTDVVWESIMLFSSRETC